MSTLRRASCAASELRRQMVVIGLEPLQVLLVLLGDAVVVQIEGHGSLPGLATPWQTRPF